MPGQKPMKKSLPYEIGAVVLGLAGAVVLVAVYLPLINPAFFQSKFGRDSMPTSFYIGGTAVAVAILGVAIALNSAARRMKKG